MAADTESEKDNRNNFNQLFLNYSCLKKRFAAFDFECFKAIILGNGFDVHRSSTSSGSS